MIKIEFRLENPGGTREVLYCSGEQIFLGKRGDVSLPADKGVSDVHAMIFLSDNGPKIHDLGSRNGTYLNGSKITETKLVKPGDTVTVGGTSLVVASLRY